eukprot:tig00020824_g14229.t1
MSYISVTWSCFPRYLAYGYRGICEISQMSQGDDFTVVDERDLAAGAASSPFDLISSTPDGVRLMWVNGASFLNKQYAIVSIDADYPQSSYDIALVYPKPSGNVSIAAFGNQHNIKVVDVSLVLPANPSPSRNDREVYTILPFAYPDNPYKKRTTIPLGSSITLQ